MFPRRCLVLMRASVRRCAQPHEERAHTRTESCETRTSERLLQRFDEEFARSAIRNKFTLDTTDSTPEETFQEFLCKMEPFWTEGDRLRMLTHGR